MMAPSTSPPLPPPPTGTKLATLPPTPSPPSTSTAPKSEPSSPRARTPSSSGELLAEAEFFYFAVAGAGELFYGLNGGGDLVGGQGAFGVGP